MTKYEEILPTEKSTNISYYNPDVATQEVWKARGWNECLWTIKANIKRLMPESEK